MAITKEMLNTLIEYYKEQDEERDRKKDKDKFLFGWNAGAIHVLNDLLDTLKLHEKKNYK